MKVRNFVYRLSLASLLAGGIGMVAISAPAGAENYPTRSIAMIVPLAAGGPTDTVARAAKAAPDRYTGLIISKAGVFTD